MSGLMVPIFIAALGIESFASGCLVGPAEQREMLYSHRVPIADRLLPGDKEVLVYKQVTSLPDMPLSSGRETYEREIQTMQLGDIIALVRVANVQGELIEQGTWIRTIVSAQINQLVQSTVNRPLGDSIEFTFSGGNTRIGDVDVTAGAFPRFVQGEQYLVFLVARPRVTLGSVFHVNAGGVLEHIKSNTGADRSFLTHLIGRNVSEVLKALTPIKQL